MVSRGSNKSSKPQNAAAAEEEKQYALDTTVLMELEGDKFQIESVVAVPVAVWSVCHYFTLYQQQLGSKPQHEQTKDQKDAAAAAVVVAAVGFGGDTDTVGSMVGAMVGALFGTSWTHSFDWFNQLENGEWGRDYLISTATQLAKLCFADPGEPGVPEVELKQE